MKSSIKTMNVFDSDSGETISSDSDDIIIESIMSDSTDDLEKSSSSKSDPKSPRPVYVQSLISKTSSVTSTTKSPEIEAQKTYSREVHTEPKVTTIITSPKTYAVGAARPTVVAPNSNGMVTARKVMSTGSNVTYVTGVWQGDKRKVVLAPVKRSHQEVQQGARVVLPGTTPQTQAVAVTAVSGTSSTSSMNFVISQAPKQISKGYIVGQSAVGGRGTVSILPRNSLYIDGAAGGAPKIFQTSFIKPRDGRIISTSTLRPVNVVSTSGGRLITSSNLPTGYNLIAVPNKTRPVLPVKTTASTANTCIERRVLIGNPTEQSKLVSQEVLRKGNICEVSSQENAAMVEGEARSALDYVDDVKIISGDDSTIVDVNSSPSTDVPSIVISVDPQSSNCSSFPDTSHSEIGDATLCAQNKSENRNTPKKIAEDVNTPSLTVQEQPEGPNNDKENCKIAPDVPLPEETKPQEDIVTIEDDNDDDPPEKQSAIRKAKILSFPKPRPKNSLLNGSLLDAPLSTSKSSLIVPERVRKRKDNHKTTVIGEPPQKLPTRPHDNIKPIPGAENQHPLKAIRWDGNGMGILPGSTIKLTCNEYGMIEVLEDLLASKMEYYKDSNGEVRVKKRDPSEIYCCTMCSCYGLLSEFFNENFCSIVCWETMTAQQEAIIRKMEDRPTPLKSDEPPNDSDPRKRRKQLCLPENYEEEQVIDEPPSKQQKMGSSYLDPDDDSNSSSQKSNDNASKLKSKVKSLKQEKSEVVQKPFIKVKSMDSLTGSPVTGRQLRTRDSPSSTAKKTSKFIVGQDLEGLTIDDDDDDKIKGEQIDPFPWSDYLAKTESKAAWIKLFSVIYPTSPCLFKIGFKLEAIDPERQSLFCAATVSDVQGHRIKIHFDGYSNKYDFWTNIDSPNIFPCGFCERQQIPLQPPAGFKRNLFSWQMYHNTRKSRPAPLSWFHNYRSNSTSTNMFRNGMKLEAVDKKNTQLICVSTVAGVLDNRILVHFDSWSDVYDYWVETSSPYIHPVGWCEERNRELTPPNGYNPATFSWDSYLKLTKSEAAPSAAFTLRPPKEFKKNTKLEAIDKRAPHILRVATIKEVLPYQIKLAFDGFPEHFGYWTDDDSPDIHPVNWGLRTGHPIAGPPEIRQINLSSCTTPGCIGDGNYKGLMAEYHSSPDECPYTTEHLNSESPLQDRLASKATQKKKPPALGHESNSDNEEDPNNLWKFMDAAVERSSSKDRLSVDGTLVKLPNLRPPHQTFRNIVDPSNSTSSSKVRRKGEEITEVASSKRNPKKTLERRVSERNIKSTVSPRLRDKATAGIQAGSPMKGVTQLNDNTNVSTDSSGKSKISSQPKQDIDVRIRTKVSSDDQEQKRDVVLWNAQKCLEKLEELGPKFLASFKDLNINGGKLLMMNEHDLQYKGLLTVSESKTLFSLISDLRKEASLGLDLWKKVERV